MEAGLAKSDIRCLPRAGRHALTLLAVLLGGFAATQPATAAASSQRTAPSRQSAHAAQSSNPLTGRAMWIWVLSTSDSGSLSSLISVAHEEGVSTLIIKSGDGSGAWGQFDSQLVSTLHANHLRVCAWQYVYGTYPAAEAQIGAQSVADGADCLVIDAESEYEGKYVSAQTYLKDLRRAVGYGYPLALAGFPYVDYHPAFPYSVFLGPGGAQYNAPQMYWKDIGVTVDAVYAHTFAFNRIFGRQIFPLGQVYENPPPSQIKRFRALSRAYDAGGVSWWDWQEATTRGWSALSSPVGSVANFRPYTSLATLGSGAHGDLVVWAQEHLRSAGERIAINGKFDRTMTAAVENFQTAHGLSADGLVGTFTWSALLRYAPARVTWVARGSKLTASTARAGLTPVPASASLRAKRNELGGDIGAGRPH